MIEYYAILLLGENLAPLLFLLSIACLMIYGGAKLIVWEEKNKK